MIDDRSFFEQPVKYAIRSYEHIRKITTGQRDDCRTDCLLDYPYSKESYKLIGIDLSKWKALSADQEVIQQINFAVNLEGAGNTTMFSIIEEKLKSKKLFCISHKKRWKYCKSIPQWKREVVILAFNKSKSTAKNAIEETLTLLTDMVGNNKTNFLHNLLLKRFQIFLSLK